MISGKKVTSKEQIKKILGIPDDVADIVDHQTSSFENLPPQYVIDHYKLGPSDVVAHFYKGDFGLLKNEHLYEEKFSIKNRTSIMAKTLQDLSRSNPEIGNLMDELNLVIPICLSDMPVDKMQHVPALTFSKNSFSNSILMPSLNSIYGHVEYEMVDYLDKPILHKQNKMSFAGSLTNIGWNGHGIQYNQRLQMAWMAKQAPDLWSCKIMKPPKFDDEEWAGVVEEVEKYFPGLSESGHFCQEEEKVTIQEQLKYKFQLSVDGHTSAWGRLPWQLKSNSVVIKIRNPQDDFVEWFYPLLQSSKHLLEVDTHNLMEVFQYLIHEPEEQMKLSNNASDFSDKYLSSDFARKLLLYTLLILNQKQSFQEPQRGEE
tara:strand:+ start:1339 stop:2454 length:1116 start_codon:yes stop_codon:yes gene_type:complete